MLREILKFIFESIVMFFKCVGAVLLVVSIVVVSMFFILMLPGYSVDQIALGNMWYIPVMIAWVIGVGAALRHIYK